MYLEDGIKIRSTNINLLKFICALLVIISHASAVAENKIDILAGWLNGQSNIGGVAVAVFFFLSGFYVSKSIVKSKNIWDFFKKRCLRIFPQLGVVVVGSAFVLGPILSTLSLEKYFINVEVYKYLLNIILLPVHNLPGVFTSHFDSTVNGPLWTMPVEFFCYIVLAIVFFGLNKLRINNRGISYIIMTIALYFMYMFLIFKVKSEFLVTVFRPIICFFVGMIFYEYRSFIKLKPIVGILTLIVLFTLKINPLFNLLMVFVIPYSICAIALGLPQLSIKGKIFNCSYEMYLLGWPIQQIIVEGMGNMSAILNWIIAIPIDICIGFILYKAIERFTKG